MNYKINTHKIIKPPTKNRTKEEVEIQHKKYLSSALSSVEGDLLLAKYLECKKHGR